MKDNWALVTGATAGLGLAVAEGLAGAGANIVLHDLVAPKQAADDLHGPGAGEFALDVGDLGEVGEEPLRRTEEERAIDAVRDDVLAQQLVLFGVVDLERNRRLGERGRAGDVAQCEDRGDRHADLDGDDEVEHDRGRRGQDQDDGVRARRAQDGADVVGSLRVDRKGLG